MEKLQLFAWIADIIGSCNHDFHFEAVENLIQLYFKRTADEIGRDELKILAQERWNDIHLILR